MNSVLYRYKGRRATRAPDGSSTLKTEKKMTKKISLLIIVAVIFALLLCLTSCDVINGILGKDTDDGPVEPPAPEEPPEEPEEEPEEEEPTVDLSGVTLSSETLVYDGRAHSITVEGDLPEGVTVAYVGNSVKNAGTHTVTARFYLDGKHLEDKDLTATITIERAVYDMYGVSFDGATLVAGGAPYDLFVSGTLPEGVRVLRYDGNGHTEVGEHTVTAVFQYDEQNYEPIENMTATLRVVDGPARFAGICLPDLTAVYDGRDHQVTTGGAPTASYLVEYGNNTAKNAGEYSVSARIFDGTSELTIRSTMKIVPAKLNVKAEDKTVTYDGNKHSVALKWGGGTAPVGVSVTELGNGTAAIGTHSVRFRFSLDESMRGNYLYQPDITATLTIEEPESFVVDGMTFKSVSGGYAVEGYTGAATSVIIPKEYTNSLGIRAAVVEIAAGAFMNNTSISCVYIPESVKTIGNNAFRGCTSLESVTLGSKIESIGQLAFADTAVRDVTLPDSLKAIGHAAYRGAPVERIVLPFIGGSRVTSNPYIGYIFGAPAYAGNEQYLPEELKLVVLSEKCTYVPAYAFFGASMIEEVKLSDKVTEIGISAFQGCTSLIGLYIPKSVTDIPASANNYNSPIYNCKDGFVIGTGVASKTAKPAGWGNRFDIQSSTARATVQWNVSYGEYMDLILSATYFEKN